MKHRLALFFCAVPFICVGQVAFTGSPDPFTVNANGVGQITLMWSAPGVSTTEVHLLSQTGQLFARNASSGSAATGDWVTDGMTFYLQDTSMSTPGTTLATFTAHSAATAGLPPNTNLLVSLNNGQQLFYNVTGPTLLEIHLFIPSGPLLARVGPGQGTVNTGAWVLNGMRFYLQDVSNGNPLTYQYTVASVSATPPVTTGVIFGPAPGVVSDRQDTGLATAALYWNAPGTSALQIRVGAPNGPLFAETGSYGFGDMTGWVTAGMVLYLQDASSGDPTSASNTLAISTVDLQPAAQHYVAFATPNYGVQFYSRDSGYLLGLLYLRASVSVVDLKTGPDGTLLYVAGSDGNIYVIDPSTLSIASTIQLGENFPEGGPAFIWIKDQHGKDLILTAPDGISGNLSVVDPTSGAVTNTIVCNCADSVPVYDPFNQTTYLQVTSGITGLQIGVQTVTADLQLGPTLFPLTPAVGKHYALSLQIIPLAGGTQGRLLLTWSEIPFGVAEGGPSWVSYIHDLSTGLETDAFKDQAGEVPSSSPDGQAVYAQAMSVYFVGCCGGSYGFQFGPVSLYQVTQSSDGSPTLSLVTSTSLPSPNVITPPVTHDDQFVYLENQAATFSSGYVPEGPLYIYKADPRTLKPVGATDFINTGVQNSINPGIYSAGAVAAGSYVFTGCSNGQTGSFCSP